MRLLNPKEHKSALDEQKAKAQHELIELSTFVEGQKKELDRFKEETVTERKNIETAHKLFIGEAFSERENLFKEIIGLEERKKEAEKPLDDTKIELDKREVELENKENDLNFREQQS